MAHTVHPKGFRLHKTEDWNSRWIVQKNYAANLQEDFVIREIIQKRFRDASIERIEIERFAGKLNILISTARPGLIIGRGGSGIEELRKAIIAKLQQSRKIAQDAKSKKPEVRLEIREIKNPWTSAQLTAQWVAQQLEKRMPHRRVLKQAMGKVMANKEIEGVRIGVAGRLGGADMSRREEIREGRLPLQTLRSDIDYALYEAQTTYGTIGVKVWMYKGEKFE